MNLLCSWGGVGTTVFLDYLSQMKQYSCNPARGYLNPLKHPLKPPPGAARAVFLFGCPYLSLVSLFRRGYDALHYVNINQLFPAEQPFPHGDLWQQTCERFALKQERPGVWIDADGRYADQCGALDWLKARKVERDQALKIVQKLAHQSYQDFDGFLAKAQDIFRRQEQWDHWRAGAEYPVMLVRYETLWCYKERVLQFLEVPNREWSRFPARVERLSTLKDLTEKQSHQLQVLYGKLALEIEQTPDIVELGARDFKGAC